MAGLEQWGEFATARAEELPPELRHAVAGLYRLVVGEDRGDLDAAVAGGADPAQLAAAVEVLVAALGLPVWTRAGWPAVSRIRPADGSDDAAKEHYDSSGDEMPAPIGELARQYPDFTELFLRTRQAMVDGRGLDPAIRELMLCLLSAQGGYLDGARRHLVRAHAAGLSREAIADLLTCTVVTHGASAWEAYGRALWEAAADLE